MTAVDSFTLSRWEIECDYFKYQTNKKSLNISYYDYSFKAFEHNETTRIAHMPATDSHSAGRFCAFCGALSGEWDKARTFALKVPVTLQTSRTREYHDRDKKIRRYLCKQFPRRRLFNRELINQELFNRAKRQPGCERYHTCNDCSSKPADRHRSPGPAMLDDRATEKIVSSEEWANYERHAV